MAGTAISGVEGFDMRGFIANSLLEWEDRISAVVVAGGCNLRCPYCHSWRYVTGLEGLERLDTGMVFDVLKRQEGWIDGVVFTGGEATLQPGLGEFMGRVKGCGVETKLHTNGTCPDVVRGLLGAGVVDCVALDYKAPFDGRYFGVAGIEVDGEILERVRETFGVVAGSGVMREYHTTLDPRAVDVGVLGGMAEELEGGGVWILQQFESGDCLEGGRRGVLRYDGEQLDELESIARAAYKGRVIMQRGSQGA